MTVVEAFVPAKVNLTLHVTGQREDGYHLLDSLVVFADIGDRIAIRPAETTTLRVEGPMSAGVPTDETNLVVRAAHFMGVSADILIEKNLPNAAGLGGGSGDAAATLRVLSGLSGKPIPENAIQLGADVPICLLCRSARVRGIGNEIEEVTGLPPLYAVLVNPNRPVPTSRVFQGLKTRQNPPMPDPIPATDNPAVLIEWLQQTRNDLEQPAIEAEPVIRQVFETLEVTPGCLLARMSGSGGTCFGLYADAETAGSAAGRLRESNPGWWVAATQFNPPLRFS
jgi:4-diphosphocytidyl-2-C-methyl-D-erythritol kinase